MRTRKLGLIAAAAALGLLGLTGIALANDPEPEDIETREGVIETTTDADGDVEYTLDGVPLSVGPPWFWGDNHPLAGLVGQSVSVTGVADDGTPAEAANERARGGGPSFDVFSVNGSEVRPAGKPPWAGGPAVVGESHPGYAGWARGQAARDAAGANGGDDAE